jgi:hypothetical protein
MEHIGKDSLTKLNATWLFRKYARENIEKKKTDTKVLENDKFIEPTADAFICPEYEVKQQEYNTIFTGGELNYRTVYTQ